MTNGFAMQLYERLKSDWIRLHPGATHEEYESAIKAIAEKCGI